MLQLLSLYLGIGAGLATATLVWPALRRTIDKTGAQLGMGAFNARTIWALSTIIAWPIGLYVRSTGRLVMADDASVRPATPSSRTPQP